MKRVSDLIVGSVYDATLDLTSADLTAGSVGDLNIIDLGTNLAAVPATLVGPVVIAKICADSDGNKYFRQSLPIHKGSITSYRHSAFAASAAKVVTVDITGAPITVGSEYTIWITDYNDSNYIVGRRRISYVVQTGDTLDTAGAALADAITNDVSIPNVSASYNAGTDVITITGVAVAGSGNVINGFRAAHEILFNVFVGDALLGIAVVTTTVNPDPGCGTFREVRKMEETYKGYRGFTNRVMFPTSVNIQYDSVSGTEYDLFVIEHKAPQHTNTEGDVHAEVVTTIAHDTADAVGLAALITDLQAVIDVM